MIRTHQRVQETCNQPVLMPDMGQSGAGAKGKGEEGQGGQGKAGQGHGGLLWRSKTILGAHRAAGKGFWLC
jgi:hypothetical protein